MAKENMMETTQITDMDAFASAIKQRMEQTHPSANVEIREVPQNNSLALTGITVYEKGRNIAPTIYLEDFFEAYQAGKLLDEISRIIEEINRRATPDTNFDLSGIMAFSAVKEKICYKLVNAAKNAAQLKEMPHRLWQDLAIIYYVPVSIETVADVSTITVNNSMMELWGVDEDTLYRQAHRNTPKLFKAEITPIIDVLKNMLRETESPEAEMIAGMLEAELDAEFPEGAPQLYAATNDRQMNGAAVLLYDGILERFARQTGCDFYILPSSIHETLFLPAAPDSDRYGIPEMVRGINAGCLAPEEVLSDNAYLYHAGDGSVTLLS